MEKSFELAFSRLFRHSSVLGEGYQERCWSHGGVQTFPTAAFLMGDGWVMGGGVGGCIVRFSWEEIIGIIVLGARKARQRRGGRS